MKELSIWQYWRRVPPLWLRMDCNFISEAEWTQTTSAEVTWHVCYYGKCDGCLPARCARYRQTTVHLLKPNQRVWEQRVPDVPAEQKADAEPEYPGRRLEKHIVSAALTRLSKGKALGGKGGKDLNRERLRPSPCSFLRSFPPFPVCPFSPRSSPYPP